MQFPREKNPGKTSRVQAAIDRLNLIALAPGATALVQGSERRCENGVNGEGTPGVHLGVHPGWPPKRDHRLNRKS